jgi:hypothetical protein
MLPLIRAIDIEIVGARLAGLGELAFQALKLDDQDARAPLGRIHVRAAHVAEWP